MNEALEEGIDFYYNEDGLMVLTKSYLLNRGYCCNSGCLNCPYDSERDKRDDGAKKSE
ncbi:MAG: hypothetical protein HKN92_05415 [Chitinophagales bacterium]|nr:hypothetical protein [Chitinophagales bacterium]